MVGKIEKFKTVYFNLNRSIIRLNFNYVKLIISQTLSNYRKKKEPTMYYS